MSVTDDWNEAANELNAIVMSFDEGEVSVDELFAKLERATAIIESLEARWKRPRPKSKSWRRASRASPTTNERSFLFSPIARRTRLRSGRPYRYPDGQFCLRRR
jgi:hypothetical protein